MILAGLTGGIACGKTVVSEIFRSLGACIIDADVISHDLIKPGLPAWHLIVDRFGSGILSESGDINRHLLGSIIFRDSAKREILNSILHPRIYEEADRQRKAIEKESPDAIIIYDAALLIETGSYERVDVLILVYVDEESQVKRLMDRNGLSREDAIERIRVQMPLDKKKKYADYIIDTSVSRVDVKRQVTDIFDTLKTRGSKMKKRS